MRAVIISGGSLRSPEHIRQFITHDDYIICADSGYDRAVAMGVEPHILVGDFDSIIDIPEGLHVERYPARKDLTDTEIAVEHAIERGCDEMLLLCVTGTRIDHMLSNILLLKKIRDMGAIGEVIDENNRVRLAEAKNEINAEPGSLVSLVPITECSGVTTTNLEYPLHKATLYVGHARGVSNVVTKNPAAVSLGSGEMLIIQARD